MDGQSDPRNRRRQRAACSASIHGPPGGGNVQQPTRQRVGAAVEAAAAHLCEALRLLAIGAQELDTGRVKATGAGTVQVPGLGMGMQVCARVCKPECSGLSGVPPAHPASQEVGQPARHLSTPARSPRAAAAPQPCTKRGGAAAMHGSKAGAQSRDVQ